MSKHTEIGQFSLSIKNQMKMRGFCLDEAQQISFKIETLFAFSISCVQFNVGELSWRCLDSPTTEFKLQCLIPYMTVYCIPNLYNILNKLQDHLSIKSVFNK